MQMVEKIEIEVRLEKNGSAGLRNYLEECGFDIFREIPAGHSLEKVNHRIRLDEDGNIDDGATFVAYYNGDRDPKEWIYLRNRIESHLSVIQFLYVKKRVKALSDEVPG